MVGIILDQQPARFSCTIFLFYVRKKILKHQFETQSPSTSSKSVYENAS